MALSGRQFTIAAGEHEATLVEVGAGLRRYAVDGRDVTFSYGEQELPPKCCGAVLVPWPNRLRGGSFTFEGTDYQVALTEPARRNAIHGLGRWARWECLAHESSTVTLGLDIAPQTGWPFEVRVEVTYAVHPELGLSVAALARNTGTTRAPFGAGFHPYLAVGAGELSDVRLQLPASQYLVTDAAQIPVGTRTVAGSMFDFRRIRRLRDVRIDDALTALTVLTVPGTTPRRSEAVVRTRSGGARLWFDETFRYLQVFTPDLLAHGLPAIAIEPMTCPADAFNTGAHLIVLDPGGVWQGSWGIQPLPV